ncbi:hypothetical protein DFH08DRAFT_966900 [Mycena albidolilacea]|uniref:Uncharacterized protein n=1 Tax=Mycena albidolilacea TaxID=1033008 RepID=A0AAD6ZMZ4_9AGAR|nr:hypothetical protein DFH08DRAFT_966900 [Mycena albidolilacea]
MSSMEAEGRGGSETHAAEGECPRFNVVLTLRRALLIERLGSVFLSCSRHARRQIVGGALGVPVEDPPLVRMAPPAFRQRNAQQDPTALESANVESSSAGAPTSSRPPRRLLVERTLPQRSSCAQALDSRTADPMHGLFTIQLRPRLLQTTAAPAAALAQITLRDEGRAEYTDDDQGDSAEHRYVEERERRMGRTPGRRRTRTSSSVGDASDALGAIPAGHDAYTKRRHTPLIAGAGVDTPTLE